MTPLLLSWLAPALGVAPPVRDEPAGTRKRKRAPVALPQVGNDLVKDLRKAAPRTVPLAARFAAKVEHGPGCWEWTGAKSHKGYGKVYVGRTERGTKRLAGAHRVAFELAFGPVPDGMLVRHRCDNPGCVRPDHLELGTVADNTADMMVRGRHRIGVRARGSANRAAKMDEAKVVEARRLAAEGRPVKWLASDFGVSVAAMWRIVRGICWTHVPGAVPPRWHTGRTFPKKASKWDALAEKHAGIAANPLVAA